MVYTCVPSSSGLGLRGRPPSDFLASTQGSRFEMNPKAPSSCRPVYAWALVVESSTLCVGRGSMGLHDVKGLPDET